MNQTIKWNLTPTGEITSEDTTVSVYEGGDSWVMEDSIDGDKVVYNTKQEALDAGGRRLLQTETGNFSVFIPVLDKKKELVFTHQIS